MIEPRETYHPLIEEIVELGDRVVVLGQDRGRMKGMNRKIEEPKGAVIHSFEAAKVTRIEYFFDRHADLRAAGLDA